ncbi:MAG: hypothetical protein WAX66_00990 [Patescibacteria group bacterium]
MSSVKNVKYVVSKGDFVFKLVGTKGYRRDGNEVQVFYKGAKGEIPVRTRKLQSNEMAEEVIEKLYKELSGDFKKFGLMGLTNPWMMQYQYVFLGVPIGVLFAVALLVIKTLSPSLLDNHVFLFLALSIIFGIVAQALHH